MAHHHDHEVPVPLTPGSTRTNNDVHDARGDGGSSSSTSIISSIDKTIQVTLEHGVVTSISTITISQDHHKKQETRKIVDGRTFLQGMIQINRTQQPLDESGGIRIISHYYTTTTTSTISGLMLEEYYTPTESSIHINITVKEVYGLQVFTAPIVTTFGIDYSNNNNDDNTSNLFVWAPWDRKSRLLGRRGKNKKKGQWIDPLQPQPFSNQSYIYGYATDEETTDQDVIVAPMISILNHGHDDHTASSFSVLLDPTDLQLELELLTTASGTVMFQRFPFRFNPQKTTNATTLHYTTFQVDLIGHVGGGCFRPALQYSVNRWPQLWNPANEKIRDIEGLGSYSWYQGDLKNTTTTATATTDSSSSVYDQMGYSVNWDLGGKFFPYMGQFLPPVSDDTSSSWSNDPEGSQPKVDNVTLRGINEYYSRIQAQGFHTLSYFNVFEYGFHIVQYNDSPLKKGNESTTRDGDDWKNSSVYLAHHFPKAVVTHACKHHMTLHTGTPIRTWQDAVVVNPSDGGYEQFLLEQLQRKLQHLSAFEGLVVDRSDWAALYDLNRDDGVSFACGRKSYSMKRSFQRITTKLRTAMMKRRHNKKGDAGAVMLINTAGYAMLSFMGPFDGSYSEGWAINAAGLLGLASPAILWTYGESNWNTIDSFVVSRFDDYMQRHLYMGVYPMAPFPGNDHAIPPREKFYNLYRNYGPLFRAVKGANWILEPHPASVSSLSKSRTTSALVNAFYIGGKGTHSSPRLWPIVFGKSNETVELSVRLLDETTTTTTSGYYGMMEVLYPDLPAEWVPLLQTAVVLRPSGRVLVIVVNVTLGSRGCALVRFSPRTAPQRSNIMH